jgi:hypothetical protein
MPLAVRLPLRNARRVGPERGIAVSTRNVETRIGVGLVEAYAGVQPLDGDLLQGERRGDGLYLSWPTDNDKCNVAFARTTLEAEATVGLSPFNKKGKYVPRTRSAAGPCATEEEKTWR